MTKPGGRSHSYGKAEEVVFVQIKILPFFTFVSLQTVKSIEGDQTY